MIVTASHNPVEDNGLKMVDADGGMLAHSWETVMRCSGNCRVVPWGCDVFCMQFFPPSQFV